MYIDSSSYSLLSSQSEFIFYAATNSFIDAVTHNVTIKKAESQPLADEASTMQGGSQEESAPHEASALDSSKVTAE